MKRHLKNLLLLSLLVSSPNIVHADAMKLKALLPSSVPMDAPADKKSKSVPSVSDLRSYLPEVNWTTLETKEKGLLDVGMNKYSEGFRVGRLDKSSIKGLMMKSTESELSMGRNSAHWCRKMTKDEKTKKETCKKVGNPWTFSNSKETGPKLQDWVGRPAIIYYRQAGMKSPTRKTDYTAVAIGEITRKVPQCIKSSRAKTDGDYSKGSRSGRLVKLSFKGGMIRTWEAIIQVGNSGSNFIEMSITDEGFAKCSLQVMASGKEVIVEYAEFNAISSLMKVQDTPYRILGYREIEDF